MPDPERLAEPGHEPGNPG